MAACQVENSDKATKVLGVSSSAIMANDDNFQLTYNNGDDCVDGKKRATHIVFECDPGTRLGLSLRVCALPMLPFKFAFRFHLDLSLCRRRPLYFLSCGFFF